MIQTYLKTLGRAWAHLVGCASVPKLPRSWASCELPPWLRHGSALQSDTLRGLQTPCNRDEAPQLRSAPGFRKGNKIAGGEERGKEGASATMVSSKLARTDDERIRLDERRLSTSVDVRSSMVTILGAFSSMSMPCKSHVKVGKRYRQKTDEVQKRLSLKRQYLINKVILQKSHKE